MRTQITFETKSEEVFNKIEAEAEKQGRTKASLCRFFVIEKLNELIKKEGKIAVATIPNSS